MSINNPPAGFCTLCRYEIQSFEELEKCPNCGTGNIPCSYEDQIQISINWHELRILGVWAENHARSINEQGTIYSITQSLESQFPEKTKLTLAGEFNDLKKEFPSARFVNEKGKDIPT